MIRLTRILTGAELGSTYRSAVRIAVSRLAQHRPMSTKPNRSVQPGRADEGSAAEVRSFLSLLEAAEYLGVASSFLRRLVYERRITYYKLGRYLRFNPADLDEYVLTTRVDTFAQQPWVPELTTGGGRHLGSSSG